MIHSEYNFHFKAFNLDIRPRSIGLSIPFFI